MAQLAEHSPPVQEVLGSNPSVALTLFSFQTSFVGNSPKKIIFLYLYELNRYFLNDFLLTACILNPFCCGISMHFFPKRATLLGPGLRPGPRRLLEKYKEYNNGR